MIEPTAPPSGRFTRIVLAGLLGLKIIWRTAYLPHRDWSPRADGSAPEPSLPPEPSVPVAAPSLPAWARDVANG